MKLCGVHRFATVCCSVFVCSLALATTMSPPAVISAMQVPHGNGGVVSYGGRIYVYGGVGAGGDYGPRHESYDPQTGAWQSEPSLPSGRAAMAEFELNGYLYCIGGEGPYGGQFNNTVFRWRPGEPTWETRHAFPVPSWDMLGAVCNGKAYVFGGRHGYGGTYAETREYDETNDAWNTRAAMPVSVMLGGVAVIDGKIWVFGGVHKPDEPTSQWVRHLQVFDPNGGWSLQSDWLPWQPYQLQVVVQERQVYFFSDLILVNGSWVPNAEVRIYALDSGCWSSAAFAAPVTNYYASPIAVVGTQAYFTDTAATVAFRVPVAERLLPGTAAAMQVPHGNGGVVSYGGRIYVYGGVGAGGDYGPRHESYDPQAGAWQSEPSLPSGRAAMAEFELNGYLYCVGGEGPYGGQFNNTVFRWRPGEPSWQPRNAFPVPSWDMLGAVCDGKAYVFGGRHGYGGTYADTREYDEVNDAWNTRAAMPVSVMLGGVAAIDGKIWVFGGVHKPNESTSQWVRHLQVFDPNGGWSLQSDWLPWQPYQLQVAVQDRHVYFFSDLILVNGSWVPNAEVRTYALDSGCWSSAAFAAPVTNYYSSPLANVDGQVYGTDTASQMVLRVPLNRARRLGDLNCDGVLNFADINPFVLRLSEPGGYAAQYPTCDGDNADINGDGEVDFADINPFVAILVR